MHPVCAASVSLYRQASAALLVLATLTLFVLGSSPALAIYHNLYSFLGPAVDGSGPVGALVEEPGQNIFFGTTRTGGGHGFGTVYVWNQGAGLEAVIHSFTGVAGGDPTGTLIIKWPAGAAQGTLWGTTLTGGKFGFGTVWRMATNGAGFVILHNFTGGPGDGANPWAGVILHTDGLLYGTTVRGGSANLGTVYDIKPGGGPLAIIHNFTGATIANAPDGSLPYARLYEIIGGAFNGQLAGTTATGGGFFATGAIGTLGTVYQLGPAGVPYNILHTFAGGPGDGANPTAEVISVPNAAGPFLTGTTFGGGGFGDGSVYRVQPGGALYQVVYNFTGPPVDGARVWGALVLGNTGFLYGLTRSGGAFNDGIVYELNPAVAPPYPEVVRYSFAGGFGAPPDGSDPYDALVQSTVDNYLYGDCFDDGNNFDGILFNISP